MIQLLESTQNWKKEKLGAIHENIANVGTLNMPFRLCECEDVRVRECECVYGEVRSARA